MKTFIPEVIGKFKVPRGRQSGFHAPLLVTAINPSLAADLFSRFGPSRVMVPIGTSPDFLGIIESPHYEQGSGSKATLINEFSDRQVTGQVSKLTAIPDINEEIFEWIDLLESVKLCNSKFIFVELGAGYGRWAARAFRAAVKHGLSPENITLVTVEPESDHFSWIGDHFKLNEIAPGQDFRVCAALSNWTGEGDFFVARPGENGDTEPNEWYGQALAKSDWEGAITKRVAVVTLSNVLECLGDEIIDLIDMDIQGEDALVLQEAEIHLARVKRVHVGTNSVEDEREIRKFFTRLGWLCIRDWQTVNINATEFGPIQFLDGVQTWINSELVNLNQGTGTKDQLK